jgi:predicted chitinase
LQDLGNKRIISEHVDYSIDALKQMFNGSFLISNQDFQRDYFYDNKKASKIVESALLRFP